MRRGNCGRHRKSRCPTADATTQARQRRRRTASSEVAATAAAPKNPDATDTLDGKVRIGTGANTTDWDIENEPVAIPWLPDFANDWLTIQARHGFANANRINTDPKAFINALLKTVPTMLFLLVPVFALLLKVLYFFSRRTYLEHLVVALYSHCWLLLALFAIFVSMTLRHGVGSTGVAAVLGVFEGLLWLAMPIYLLVMQKRVYGQGWPMTLLKYFTLGSIYFVMLVFGGIFTFLVGLIRM